VCPYRSILAEPGVHHPHAAFSLERNRSPRKDCAAGKRDGDFLPMDNSTGRLELSTVNPSCFAAFRCDKNSNRSHPNAYTKVLEWRLKE